MKVDKAESRPEIPKLEAERDALKEKVGQLEARLDRAVEWGAWLACQEAEDLLADLLGERGGKPEGEKAAGVELRDTGGEPEEHRSLDEALGESRQRLLAIRDAVRARDRRLAELQRQKDELLSIVAHDLRTPLVAIQGFAQLLKLSGETSGLTEKQKEYVERIFQAVQAMDRLVDDILTTRQLDQGRLPLRPRAMDVTRFVADLLDIQREAARQKDVEIHLECVEELPPATFDPDRLAQALGNLLQNAVKFTPQGGRVNLTVSTQGGRVRFLITDQGPGIDEELLPNIFNRCAPGRIAETAGRGYGLGLFICRQIAGLHGGRVGAGNVEEGGSCFWLEIPFESNLEVCED